MFTFSAFRKIAFQAPLLCMIMIPSLAIYAEDDLFYETLLEAFRTPDHAEYGEVPLWWWEGAKMSQERITWQLETLAEKGVKAVCPIQRSPGRCDPQSFEPEWWELFRYVNEECKRLGMKLWAYDQIGYGHYGWLEKAAARTQDENTYKLEFESTDIPSRQAYELELPHGELILARAYPIIDGIASDEQSIDLSNFVEDNILKGEVGDEPWRIVTIVARPQSTFYLSEAASETFLDMLYGKLERTLGKNSMGASFEGVFQDEHPPTPTNNYTEELADVFSQRYGYDIARAIPALHFDVGPKTPKYRTDFYDVYLELVEQTYWKKVYDWAEERGILTSHDNWGRNNIYTQSRGYMDYFRSQRWFSSPGYDDAGQRPVTERNYYDAKIASSIARLYNRPRVWNEAFHSSGWGRTTDQTLSWLSAGMAFGANLYDEHGLYYSTNASTWEHAAPDPHWRQPYWEYYGALSDWVARTSYLMSQGQHVVDAAVHYPVVSLLADVSPDQSEIDYNLYMRLSKTLYDAEIDNDIVDDDSILAGEIRDGQLWMGGNGYRALVFGPEKTMRRSVLEKAIQFAHQGGVVMFYERLPMASTEVGRHDSRMLDLWSQLLGVSENVFVDAKKPIIQHTPNQGLAAYVPSGPKQMVELISNNIDRDFQSQEGGVYYTHRVAGDTHIYLVQNVSDEINNLQARFRVDAVPEIWNPFTGRVESVDQFERENGYTHIQHRLEGNTAVFFVFKPGEQQSAINQRHRIQPEGKQLASEWEFSVIPTRDNRWGEFRWPPSHKKIGPEVRTFQYQEEQTNHDTSDWHKVNFDDQSWSQVTYSMGPYWLMLGPVDSNNDLPHSFLTSLSETQADDRIKFDRQQYEWQTIEFSKQIGLAQAVPWGGHSGYPDGHIDRNFIQLPEGRKLLYTRIRSPKAQRVGLRVELRNSEARLWVNGEEQPFEGAVGNLPLQQGANEVLLDLPDGRGGKLYVQKTPPSVQTLSEAAENVIAADLREANWIWVDEAHACYMRKTFHLDHVPETAQLIVTAFSGYRLYVNGFKLEEEIGPWARWTHPETFNITPYLQEGENVVALWGQLYFGQHVNRDAVNHRGAILAIKARNANGDEYSILTDNSWKGIEQEESQWATPGFDDSHWPNVDVRGAMGDDPWGTELLENIGKVSEPKRPLSVNLDSPYLECFEELPDIVYDIKPTDASRIGWYRFQAPPGLQKMHLDTNGDAQVWINGKSAEVRGNLVTVAQPPKSVSQVAIRLEMQEGQYSGAAFTRPIGLELEGGTIEPGDWERYALPTYSGIGVYKQTVSFRQEELTDRNILDLGEVKVAAEVLVNGESAGVRLAHPFKYDISPYLHEGENTIEVHVANTIAPHYQTIPALHLGPTQSGLLGPVRLHQELPTAKWINWANDEIQQLEKQLESSTPELRRKQQKWEKTAAWLPINSKPEIKAGSAHQKTYFYDVNGYENPITGLRFHLSSSKKIVPSEIKNLQVDFIPEKETPIRGRYIRVEIPDRAEYLSLAELQVFHDGNNIALEGKASQSNTSAEGYARLAIDGNTDGRYFVSHSVTHTPHHHNPWWELDLGAVKEIDQIVLWNRTDRAQEENLRLHNFNVAVLDENRESVWSVTVQDPPSPNVAFHFSGPRSLHLSDLQVWQGKKEITTRVQAENRAYNIEFSDGLKSLYKLTANIAGDLQAMPGQLAVTMQSENCTFDGVSVTQMGRPLVNIPKAINDLLRMGHHDKQQDMKIANFYRSITPLLEQERNRLHRLNRELSEISIDERHADKQIN